MSEKPTDTCGTGRNGLHERCYEPCLCRDRGHPAEKVSDDERRLARALDVVRGTAVSNNTREQHALAGLRDVLRHSGYMFGSDLTDDGRALLDRARKAGVL